MTTKIPTPEELDKHWFHQQQIKVWAEALRISIRAQMIEQGLTGGIVWTPVRQAWPVFQDVCKLVKEEMLAAGWALPRWERDTGSGQLHIRWEKPTPPEAPSKLEVPA